MKRLFLLLTAIYALLPAILFGQDKDPAFNLFGKGINEFPLKQNLSLDFTNLYEDGDKTSRYREAKLYLEHNYFVADGFAIGAQVIGDWSGEYNGSDYLYRDWSARLNFTYGKQFDNFNLYARLGAGYGKTKDIEKTPTNTYTNQWDKFNISGKIASPFVLNDAKNVYVTPAFTYSYATYSYDESKEKESEFGLRINLENYSPCSQMGCDRGRKFSKGKYEQGDAFIDYYSKIRAVIGTNKTKYDNFPDSYTDNSVNIRGSIRGGFYIVDNVALGLDLDLTSGTQKQKDTDYKNSWTSWSVAPFINLNVPVDNAWNNMFLQLEGGVGGYTNKSSSGTNTFTDKYNQAYWGVGIGFNKFVGPDISVTPVICWEQSTEKDKETDIKYGEKGITLTVGMRYSF